MNPMIDCDAVMRQLWDFLDEELTPDRMEAIRAHLAICDRCHPHAEFERTFLRALAQSRLKPVNTVSLSTRVRAALAAKGFAPA